MRVFLLLLTVLLTGACAGRGSIPFPDPGREEDVLSGVELTTVARIVRLEDQRNFDTPTFWASIVGAPPEVRRRVAMAAGRIGDPAAAPLLIELLRTDPSMAVRADAAFGLGELGLAEPQVLAALQDAAPPRWITVRWDQVPLSIEVLAALGKIGGDDARSMVHDALRKMHPAGNPRLRRVAAEALLAVWKFDRPESNVLAAAPYLTLEDPGLRWRAAYALMRGGHYSALPHLLAIEDDPEHRVRAHTARALTALNADSAGVGEDALAWLTRALDDPHPHVRINALRALAGYGDRAPISTLAGLLNDDDPAVGTAAAGALGSLGGPTAALALTGAIGNSRLPLPLRGEALAQLATAAPDPAADSVARWAASGPRERYFAARALPFLPRAAALEILPPLAGDEDVRVAVAALGAVPALLDDAAAMDTARLRPVVLSSITSPDAVRRAAALAALEPLVRPEDAASILEAYQLSVGVVDQAPAARGAAIAALDALARIQESEAGEVDEPAEVVGRPPGVADLLFALPAPVDPWIRRAAAALGSGWGDAPPAQLGDALALFDALSRRYIAEPLSGARRPRARIQTRHGTIVVELFSVEAPLTVHNFITLARSGFYDDGVWHRVVPNFVLQDGAPRGFAEGGPGWTIRDEINRFRYDRGMLGMALAGPDTGGSQWFITHSPQPHLDGGYTIFGRVIEGMEIADAVLQGEPIFSVIVDG